jgi:hypothetical protein
MALIKGTDGIIEVGPTNAPTEVGKVTEWSATRTRETSVRGPHINSDTLEKTQGAKSISGSLTADVPAGRDPGQTALDDAFEDGLPIRLKLQSDQGKVITVTSALVSEIEDTGSAAEGYQTTFSFEDQNGYTIADAA